MPSLAAHLVHTYEDRKPEIANSEQQPHPNPPQRYQTNSRYGMNMNTAGPSRYPAQQQQQAQGHGQGGPMGMGMDDDQWLSNHGAPWWAGMMMAMMNRRENPNGFTAWSEEKVAQLQSRLSKRLGPEYVATRPGPGGGSKLTYVEGWKVINLANEVFGFNGWSSEIRSINTDFLDVNDSGRCSVCVTAHVRITLKDGAFHEDIGSGSGENIKGKGAALEKAKKEAVTDATKRALRNFGNVLGNCLYDKEYTKEVGRMRVVPVKFDPDSLERRPEFAAPKPPAPVAGPLHPTAAGPSNANAQPASAVPQRMINQNYHDGAASSNNIRAGTPLRSIHDDDITMATMDENFDAEFLNESFFEGMDMSVVDDLAAAGGQTAVAEARDENIAPPPPREQAQTGGPAYQHRHRPDAPLQGPAQGTRSAGASSARISQETSKDQAHRSSDPVDRSSGSAASAALQVQPATKPRGGFAYPGGGAQEAAQASRAHGNASAPPSASTSNAASNTAAAAARRKAMTSAIMQQDDTAGAGPSVSHTPSRTGGHAFTNTGPIRAGSPQIPSGGIDSAASRASAMYRAQAVKYELDSVGDTMSVEGFTSARGVKRVQEDSWQTSPSKQPQAGAYAGDDRGRNEQRSSGSYSRSGSRGRQPLGEMSLGPDGAREDYKRPRGV